MKETVMTWWIGPIGVAVALASAALNFWDVSVVSSLPLALELELGLGDFSSCED